MCTPPTSSPLEVPIDPPPLRSPLEPPWELVLLHIQPSRPESCPKLALPLTLPLTEPGHPVGRGRRPTAGDLGVQPRGTLPQWEPLVAPSGTAPHLLVPLGPYWGLEGHGTL